MKMQERANLGSYFCLCTITVTEKMGCCDWPHLYHVPTPIAWEASSYD